MPNVVVEFADGTKHEYQGVPDNARPEDIAARAGQEFPDRQVRHIARQESGLRGVAQRAKQVGADLVSGFGQVASMAPKAGAMLPFVPEQMAESLNATGDRTEEFWKNFGKQYGQPKGYGKATAQGIGGAPAGGGVTPVALAAGAGAGAGSEAGERLLGDSALSRFLGGLLGGVAGGAGAARLSGVRPQSGEIAREVLEGIDPKQLQQAQAFQTAQRSRGVDVDLAQALTAVGAPAANITSLRNFLASKQQGTQVQQTLQAQPGQLSMEADLVAGGLPGTNYGPYQAANNLQEAATGAVNAAKLSRSTQVRALYEQAKDLPPNARNDLVRTIQQIISQPGTTDKVAAAGKEMIAKLQGQSPELAGAVEAARKAVAEATTPSQRMAAQQALQKANADLAAAGTRPLRALDVDTWLGEMSGPFKGTPLSPVDPKAAGQMKNLSGTVNKRFQQLSPEVAAAERKFAELSETLVNSVKQSPTGQIATPRGYRADVQATMQKFDTLLEAGTDASASRSDIRTLGRQLAKTDPNAFADAVKTYVSRRIKAAMEPGADSATAANNPDMAQRIAQNLWGNELKAQGLRDAVSVAAESMKVNPTDAVRGLNNLMQLTKALSNRPAQMGSLARGDVYMMGGKSMGADALRIFGFLPFERTARRVEDAVLGKTLSEFDRILTSPEGAAKLAELGRVPVMSRKAMVIVGTMAGQVPNNTQDVTGQ